MADCVCDLYGGCCDDARQREYARTFGPSVSTASANGVDYRPLLGRVGADGPEIPKEEPMSAFEHCDDCESSIVHAGRRTRAWPPPEESAALLDPPIVPWLERLNAIPGIETLQSCSGDHPGAETPAHVWIAGRLPHSLCREIGRLDGVEDLSILYEREAFPVTEVRFNDWLTGFRNLTEYLEGWGGSG